MISAKDIIHSNYSKIEENEPISKSLSMFGNSDSLIIMNDDEYKGVLLKQDLIRAKLPLNTNVQRFITHVPKIDPDDSLEEIARLMIASNSYQLPVLEKLEKLLGIVRYEDLIKQISKEGIHDKSIKSIMHKKVTTLSPDESIGDAIKIFREQRINDLPIIENNKVIGMITQDDIMKHVMNPEKKTNKWEKYGAYITIKKEISQLPLKGIMDEPPLIFPLDTPTYKIIEHMLKFNLNVVIIGKNQQIQGMVTKKDILNIVSGETNLETFEIRFDKGLDEIKDFDRLTIEDFLREELIRQYNEFLHEGYLYVSMKQHKESKHGNHLITCHLRLSSIKGMMYATDEGYGIMQALRNSKDALEHQIKNIKRDKKADYFSKNKHE